MRRAAYLPVICSVFVSLLALSVSGVHASDGWMTDFEKAKAKARQEKKDLLIDFTGSDWCSWCIKLRREVFDQPEFQREAPKNFVLVELDYPRRSQLPKALKEQNEALKLAYRIRGYPTIYLTDADGRPYAKSGYRAGGAEEYLDHLGAERAKREQRDKLFAQARAEKDNAKAAKLLDRALSLVERKQIPLVGYETVFAEIARLDADNGAGLRAKYELRAGIEQLERMSAQRKYAALVKTADEMLKGEMTAESRQKVLFYKAFAFYNQKLYDDAVATLEAAVAAAPESSSASSIERALKQVQAQAAKASGTAKTR